MKKSAYDRVTERILELLEQGTCPWRRPWNQVSIRPQNFVSGKTYTGINLFLLEAMAFERPFFMTFKQVKEKGGTIIKGSKGFPVVYWGTIQVEDENAKKKSNGLKVIPFLKSYTVFGASQIEGIDFPNLPTANQIDFEPILEAERIIDGWKDAPAINYGHSKACYSPMQDKVMMPSKNSFESPEHFYATIYHELGHSTGHKSRLNRKFGKRFGDNQYSREELIAEMISAFLCAECGIDNSIIENSAAYLQGWMKVIKADSKLVVTAASQAQKAANLILGRQAETQNKEAA